MNIFNDFLGWAWERHHNILSWYIRPLFLLPFCYFAYKRNISGILLTLIALATSMFWFPKPEYVDPQVIAFLEMEKSYITSDWDISKVLLSLTVPLSLYLLALAFWKRSWLLGVSILTLMAFGKIIWSVIYGGESGYSILVPALLGLIICNGLVFYFYKKQKAAKVSKG